MFCSTMVTGAFSVTGVFSAVVFPVLLIIAMAVMKKVKIEKLDNTNVKY